MSRFSTIHRLLPAFLAVLALPALARADGDPVSARLQADAGQAVAEVTIAPGWHINGHEPRDAFLIPTTLDVSPPQGQTAGAITWPSPVERTLAFSPGKPLLLYEGTVKLTAPLTGGASAAAPVRARLRFQACNDTTCLPPRTLDLVAEQQTGAAGAGVDNAVADAVARWGWGVTFLWVGLLGSRSTSPLRLSHDLGHDRVLRGRTAAESTRVAHALLYVLGICITFSALGVAAALTGRSSAPRCSSRSSLPGSRS